LSGVHFPACRLCSRPVAAGTGSFGVTEEYDGGPRNRLIRSTPYAVHHACDPSMGRTVERTAAKAKRTSTSVKDWLAPRKAFLP
jgi:hypothetical protein